MNTPAFYDRLAELAFKKIKDELTHEDEQELAAIFEKSPEKKALFEELIDPAYMAANLRLIDDLDVDAAWQEYEKEADAAQGPGGNETWQQHETNREPPTKKWPWKQWLVAAAAVGLIFVYFYFKEERKTALGQQNKKVTFDSAMLANGVAMIVQANGSELLIGKEQSGIVATIGNSHVQMNKDVLQLPDMPAGVVIKALPGKQLPFLLSDSTQGWLSGNSELHFTDGFTAGKRTMVLKGESYFEVAKGAVPFAVKVPNMELKVLGTWFTISAYDGKAVKTLLYKGKVQLAGGGKNIVLTENEEAVFENNEFSRRPLSNMSKEKGNGAKEGLFVFEDDMKTILDEVARYYDCSIEYRGVVPQSPFRCKIDRNIPLKSLLDNLAEAMVIELHLSGNKIIADFTKHK